jgi:hypothetical protein
MDKNVKTPVLQKKNPTGGMDVCVVLYGSMEHKWHEGRKDLIQYKNGSKGGGGGKPPDRQKKIKNKIPPGAWMFVLCLL